MSEPDGHEPAGEPSDAEPAEVAEAASADVTAARLAELLEHASPKVRAAVVANEEAPDTLFGDTWQDSGDDVRLALISHRAHLIPAYAFPALANDPDTRVRGAALRKLPMPESMLIELARHPDQRVRRSAVKNPGATPEVQRTCEAYEAPLKKYAAARPEVGRCARGALAELGDGETAAAHVGGAVSLPEGWAWPSCRTCGEPMLLLLEVELGDVPTWVRAGSRWVFFTCKQHGDVPAAPETAGGALAPKFWERADGHYAALLFRPGEATVRHDARAGLAPKKLELSVGVESLEEVGPLTGRYFVGGQGWKVGGYPSWCQSPVELTCACGAELALLGQVPEGTTLELADGNGAFSPFLGCETYVMACTKQCDPNAVVVVVQE